MSSAINLLVSKVSEFLDIFDLSFFVAGSLALGVVKYWDHQHQYGIFEQFTGGMKVFAIILACYILGLFAFAIGRRLRQWGMVLVGADRCELIAESVKTHRLLEAEPFVQYGTFADQMDRLYVRLWAEARSIHQLGPSVSLLNRYWVMTATYDGVSAALFFWGLSFILHHQYWLGGMVAVAGLFGMYEAWRLVKYQVEELVATLATHSQRQQPITHSRQVAAIDEAR